MAMGGWPTTWLYLKSLKTPDGVTLLTVEDVETRCRGVTAVYDADDAGSAEWAKQAEAVSGELWRVLAERRKEVVRR